VSAAPSKPKTPAEAAAAITVEKNKTAGAETRKLADTSGYADVEPSPDIPKTKRDGTHLDESGHGDESAMRKSDEEANDDADEGNFIAIFIKKLLCYCAQQKHSHWNYHVTLNLTDKDEAPRVHEKATDGPLHKKNVQ
jgi:hypothetical protein